MITAIDGPPLIRPLEAGDYAAVFELWSRSPGMGLRTLDDSPGGFAKFIRRNPRTCFVAEVPASPEAVARREIAGVILCGHDGRRAFIYHAAVRESCRRRGIGRALVEAAENAVRREGITKIALVAFAANDEGNRFWEKTGYASRNDLCYRDKSLNPANI
jgi:ribosomal protein S18 acetylase RimI-like enzyme